MTDPATLAAGFAEALGGPIATESQIERARDAVNAAPLQTFTAFCRDVNGSGTTWISEVSAATVDAASLAAREQCALEWGYDVDRVHLLGLAAGVVEILEWDDA